MLNVVAASFTVAALCLAYEQLGANEPQLTGSIQLTGFAWALTMTAQVSTLEPTTSKTKIVKNNLA